MVHKSAIYSLLILLTLLAGCTAIPAAPTSGISPATISSPPAEPPSTYTVRPFPKETLYNLLMAEFAGLDNDLDTALAVYLEEARKTRDPGVVNRALRMANYLKRDQQVVDMAILWAEIEPENPEARGLAAYSLARQGQVLEAFPHAEYLLYQGDGEYFKSLAAYAENSGRDQQQSLLMLLKDLESRQPDHPDLLFGLAMVERQLGEFEAAIAHTRRLLEIVPEDEAANLMLGQLLHQTGDKPAALKFLAKAVKAHPDSKRLRLQYARLLSETDLLAAREQLSILAEIFPEDDNLAYSLGLVSQEMGMEDEAVSIFKNLIRSNRKVADSHFQLGRIAEKSSRKEDARNHYLQVRQGENVVAAAARLIRIMATTEGLDAARLYLTRLRGEHPQLAISFFQIESDLLQEQDQLDSARAVLTASLKQYPDNISLLYARSVISARQEDMAATESDLRAILSQDENNATALNALGYTMLNLTKRYDEAAELLHRADKLNPGDPAIRDSLGWLYYRQGDLDKALNYLREAYSVFPDPEVAAHLGEVLWVMGNRQEARSIWYQARQADPDNSVLRETMDRLLGKNKTAD